MKLLMLFDFCPQFGLSLLLVFYEMFGLSRP